MSIHHFGSVNLLSSVRNPAFRFSGLNSSVYKIVSYIYILKLLIFS